MPRVSLWQGIGGDLLAGLVAVLAVVALAGCSTEKANPVLPPGGNQNGGISGVALDAAASDAGADTTPEVLAGGLGDAGVPTTCDLLKQDCPGAGDACYPVGGTGKCQPAGAEGLLGSCGMGELTPLCDRGLVCIQTSAMAGACLRLCDVSHPTVLCGVGVACHPLPGFSGVGYCQDA